MKNVEERRKKILHALKNAKGAVNAQKLADNFDVTRQVIVQDIAVLKANGETILSTNRGYLYHREKSERKYSRIFKVQHKREDIVRKYQAIIDNGGVVKNVRIKHPIYGEIEVALNIQSRRCIKQFVEKFKAQGFKCLIDLTTDGIQYHLVEADTKEILDDIQAELESLHFLVSDE
ncbi:MULTISPECIES: transcription repressor NadR [unclassified Granulicatella]|uniref:transcription repressor NadR n=1 Tax=unclassified Granulicatella TaxID=2630493 RepID=UPI001073ABF4|nr:MULTISPECIES: transcription repressor NadR [unclassified Granulicatella]MBF0779589.1 transcription repressor NadR [Granulicatella sp. 19428wC4_WM01]TFU96390.1 transcription repressor NadR [Granulicatella sp. WM01]